MISVILICLGLIVLAIILIALMRRYYIRNTSDVAIIRNGFGHQRICLDRGILVLPFLHRADLISLKSIGFSVSLAGKNATLTMDRVLLDLDIELVLRVPAQIEAVTKAARTLGARQINDVDIAHLINGRIRGVIHNEAAGYTLDSIVKDRKHLSQSISDQIAGIIIENGLMVDSLAITHLVQTPIKDIDGNNAIHAEGLSHVSRVIASKQLERVHIEAETEIKIKETELERTRKRIEIDHQRHCAEIDQTMKISRFKTQAELDQFRAQQDKDREIESLRLDSDEKIKQAEIDHDLSKRQAEVIAVEKIEKAKLDSVISLNKKRSEQVLSDTALEKVRAEVMRVQENIQTEKDSLVAKRKKQNAIEAISVDREVGRIRTKTSAETLLEASDAEAKSILMLEEAKAQAAAAEAKGRTAVIAAENTLDDRIIAMRLEERKIKTLPVIAEHISKPLSTIDGIRINHISGLPGQQGERNSSGTGSSAFSSAISDIMAMSLQMPALKKIGDEMGINMDFPTATRLSDAAARPRPSDQRKTSKGGQTAQSNSESDHKQGTDKDPQFKE